MTLRDLSVTGSGWRRDWEALRGRVEGRPAADANAKLIVNMTRVCFLSAATFLTIVATLVIRVVQ
jgi:hypothetical protein